MDDKEARYQKTFSFLEHHRIVSASIIRDLDAELEYTQSELNNYVDGQKKGAIGRTKTTSSHQEQQQILFRLFDSGMKYNQAINQLPDELEYKPEAEEKLTAAFLRKKHPKKKALQAHAQHLKGKK